MTLPAGQYVPASPYCDHPCLEPLHPKHEAIANRHMQLRAQQDFQIRRHNQLNDLIWRTYTKCKEQPFSKEMEKVIEYCIEDISLVDDLLDYYKKWRALGNDILPPAFPSYKRLAIVYEKRRDYDKAVSVCLDAIKHGYGNDGTHGGMKGRMEKLQHLLK